jgi:hypothetical protein
MAGFFDGLEEKITSPLFLAGAGLLSGEGFGGAMQGMQMGTGLQGQRRKQQQEMQRQQAYKGLTAPGALQGISPDVLKLAQAAGPEAGFDILSKGVQPKATPSTVQEFEFAKQNGYTGSFMDFRKSGGGADGGLYGKAGSVFQDPKSGEFFTVQFGADGTRKIEPVQVNGSNLTPSRGVGVEGNLMYDKGSGATVRDMTDAVAGGERARVVGQGQGQNEVNAPKAFSAMEAANAKSNVVLSTIKEARDMIGPFTAGFGGSALSSLPGTAARDLAAKIDTLKANAGFAELQAMRDNSPTGGALGQVAVQELAMLQATITSLEQAQSPAQLSKALDDYEKFITESKQRRQAAYESTYGGQTTVQKPQPQQPQSEPKNFNGFKIYKAP